MIVFLTDPSIANFVVDRFVGLYKNKIVTMNLSSPFKCQYDISNLITSIGPLLRHTGDYTIDSMYVDTPEFDTDYYRVIMTNRELFYSFMIIMSYEFNDFLVLIYVGNDQFRESISESIIKLIQQRYEKDSWKINDVEDAYGIDINNTFTPRGIQILDEDLRALDSLIETGQVPPIIQRICKE